MASIDEHLLQWKHNREFIQTIDAQFSDWIVTGALYVTIHAIEALLCADGCKARSTHGDRLGILQSSNRYLKIYRPFRAMYELAHVTRYSATPNKWISMENIEPHVIRRFVYPIETSVRGLILQAKVVMEPHSELKLKCAATTAAAAALPTSRPPLK